MRKDENKELVFLIALAMLPGIGGITARKLIHLFGSPEAVFREKKEYLRKIPRIGEMLADNAIKNMALEEAQRELEYTRTEGISVFCFGEPDYPRRLSQCDDAPVLIYSKGNAKYNADKVLGVVGTRRPTQDGLEACSTLIEDLKYRGHECIIVSGLAYGIDHCAHQSALKVGLETIAVLGHGLRFLYPALHRNIANKITMQGALTTDFPSMQKPEPNNFIKRNRIIAGLSDAVIVVESGKKGGALITADLAFSYHRDVFAFPGRAKDIMSAGCNGLIKNHKAALIESCKDLEYILGWEPSKGKYHDPLSGIKLNKDETKIFQLVAGENEISVDSICEKSGMQVKIVSGILLNLEFRGLISCMPGHRYRCVNPG
jgi:DNA processing protein